MSFSTHAKRLCKQLLIGLAIVSLLLSLPPVARVHRDDRLYQDRLAEVRSLLHDPDEAMLRMEELFPDDNSVEVYALTQQIEDRQRMQQVSQRDAWYELYRAAQVEFSRGDPLLALDKVTALPLHPDLPLVRPQWPSKHDLYTTLAKDLDRARSLAYEGKHEEAFAVLSSTLDNPNGFMMPWKVESFPPGVKVETSGRIYTTPFEIESQFGESVVMTFSMEGYETYALVIDRPTDLFLHMSRVPE